MLRNGRGLALDFHQRGASDRDHNMKINMQEFKGHLDGLTQEDAGTRQRAVSGLAKYSDAEWEGSPDAITPAIEALVRPDHRRNGRTFDGPFRAEAAKTLGNIGTR